MREKQISQYRRIATGDIVKAVRWVHSNTHCIADIAGKRLRGEDGGKLVFTMADGKTGRLSLGEWVVQYADGRTIFMADRMFQFAFELLGDK